LTIKPIGYTLVDTYIGEGMNISQAAKKLGVSARTIRRYIKAGKIQAEIVSGHFGEEYRILELPPELYQAKTEDSASSHGQTYSQASGQSLVQAVDIIRELQEKNLALAVQLGIATERVRNLEEKVKLLATSQKPWWRRLFARWSG
jgi:excisionase family DNA binding protein